MNPESRAGDERPPDGEVKCIDGRRDGTRTANGPSVAADAGGVAREGAVVSPAGIDQQSSGFRVRDGSGVLGGGCVGASVRSGLRVGRAGAADRQCRTGRMGIGTLENQRQTASGDRAADLPADLHPGPGRPAHPAAHRLAGCARRMEGRCSTRAPSSNHPPPINSSEPAPPPGSGRVLWSLRHVCGTRTAVDQPQERGSGASRPIRPTPKPHGARRRPPRARRRSLNRTRRQGTASSGESDRPSPGPTRRSRSASPVPGAPRPATGR